MPQIFAQAGGVDGIRQTMGMMASLSRTASLDPIVRAQAARTVMSCGQTDWRCQAVSLMIWVQRKMNFIADPSTAEALHNPVMIAKAIEEGRYVYGDCDDFSMYLASLMLAIGLKPEFRAVGYDGGPLQHVYVSLCGLKFDATRDAWTDRPSLQKRETSYLMIPVM